MRADLFKNIGDEMKKKILIIIAIILLSTNVNAFSDVQGTWAEEYINWASSRGIFNGYNDGSFKPKLKITNAEFIKVISELVQSEERVLSNYTDVPADAWYMDALEKVLGTGLLMNTGEFNPTEHITRIEAFRLISGVYGLQSNQKGKIEFKDAEVLDNRAGLIRLVNDKIICGDSSGNLNPLNPITRAEVCKILNQTYLKYGR